MRPSYATEGLVAAIAARMFVTDEAVGKHMNAILTKLGVSCR